MKAWIRLAAFAFAIDFWISSHIAEAQSTVVRRAAAGAAIEDVPPRTNTALSATPGTRPQGTTPPHAVPAQLSRARLEQVLGATAGPTRVVRASGVTDLPLTASSVSIAPGEFVFKKMSDTARRISAVAEGADSGISPVPVKPQTGVSPAPPPPLQGTLPRPRLPARLAGATFVMPYRWLTVDSSSVERVLVPFFVLVGGGLSYDVASRTYRGLALVGVEDTLHQNEGTVNLARPLRMQLATTSGGTVTPLQIAISHTSLDYDSVRIESPDSTNVRIRTGADPAGIVIRIPVRSMTLSMIPQQPTLQGLGLGTTDIVVMLPRGIPRSDTAVVTFSSTSAPVRPSSVRMTGAEGSTVRLRSGMPGADSIRAYLDGVLVGETVVRFVGPWAFIGATLVGVVIGGCARFFGARRRKRARALYWDLLKGWPFGVLAAVASAVGLDLLRFKLDDPGALPAIVVTAAFGAWLGSRVFDRSVQSVALGRQSPRG